MFATYLEPSSLPSADPDSADQAVYGANVAIRGWLDALMHWSSFDEFHFYVPSSAIPSASPSIDMLSRAPGGERVRLKALSDFPSLAGSDSDLVLHHPGNLGGGNLLHLRNHFAAELVPVSMTQMTLSYPFLRATILDLLSQYPTASDAVICLSQASRQATIAMFDCVAEATGRSWPGELPVIPFGVDLERFQPRASREARRALSLPTDGSMLLTLGRFSPFDKADLEPLLRVFRRLVNEMGDDLYLLLVGDDKHGYASLVYELINAYGLEERTFLRTNVPADAVAHYYSAANVFVAPSDSIQESLGLTVLEAMASGLPVVASDWDGYRDLVVHDKTGLLIPTCWSGPSVARAQLAAVGDWVEDHFLDAQGVVLDADSLHDALAMLLSNPVAARVIGEAGRKRAAESFNWQLLIGRHEDLWRELSERARGARGWRRRPSYRELDLTRCFSHYATRRLGADAVIERVSDSPLTPDALIKLYGLDDPIHADLIASLTARLNEGTVTLDALTKSFAAGDAVREHVAWMLKHGFARESAPASDTAGQQQPIRTDHGAVPAQSDGALLLYGRSDYDIDLLHLSGFVSSEPFVALEVGKRRILVTTPDERARATQESRASEVLDTHALVGAPLDRIDLSRDEMTAMVIAALLARLGRSQIEVSSTFPVGVAEHLRRRNISLLLRDDLAQRRRSKRADEIAAIECAQQAIEEAWTCMLAVLEAADVARADELIWQGSTLTAERLRRILEWELHQRNCDVPDGTIIAPGTQAADAHALGSGPLRAHEAIVVDVSPRHRSGYWSDMSRTVCKGEPTAAIAEMYEVVERAQAAAIAMLRPGVLGREVHECVEDIFIEAGYATSRQSPSARGAPRRGRFTHGTGHGVGLEAHELPAISRGRAGELPLLPGDVVTIEPGLYDPTVGGVRLEDLLVITADGHRNLTKVPRALAI